MSENRNRNFSKYDTMETEELEEILRLDTEAPEGEESDTELLLYVMEVLSSRRNNTRSTGKTAHEAWESFQQNYLPEEEECFEHTPATRNQSKPGLPWLSRLIAAAAVIALVVCIPISAKAFGWEELWNVFARWAKETFSFVTGAGTEVNEPSPERREEVAPLQDLLANSMQNPNIVPTWIPDGFKLEKVEKVESPLEEIYRAFYLNNELQLTIRVRSYLQEAPEKVEITEEFLEIYEVSGTQYYIFFNIRQTRAVWITGSYQCNISGDLSVEELKLMIDSIGKG